MSVCIYTLLACRMIHFPLLTPYAPVPDADREALHRLAEGDRRRSEACRFSVHEIKIVGLCHVVGVKRDLLAGIRLPPVSYKFGVDNGAIDPNQA